MPTEPTGRRKLAAILMADVVEYGRHMGEDETATIRTLKAHRAVFTRHIQQRYGRVVDAKGDAIMAAFESVVDAVAASVEIQRQIATDNDSLPDPRQMQFRIGINLGDIVEEPDSIYGDGVTVAARLETLADPGGICISRIVHDSVRGKLPLEFDYLGEHEIKTQNVRAYRVVVPEGAEMPAPAPHIAPARSVRSWRPALLAASALILVTAGSFGTWLALRAPEQDPILAMPTGPTIAVLPFENLSGDPEQEYFSDGLTEDIITALTRFTKLSVIARNSTFAYKGKATDVRQVGRELGAQYVLEGSVRRLPDRVRVTAQLIDAESGAHVWAERYDRDLKDLFELQDEIAGQIVSRLDVEVDRAQLARAMRSSPMNFNAYDLVLQARKLIYDHSEVNHAKSRDLLERAIELDDQFAHAYIELAWVYLDEFRFGWNARPDPLDRGLAAAQRAVELDPNNGFAHWRLAKILFFRKEMSRFDFEKTRALELNPNHAETLADVGIHSVALDRTDEAYEYAQRALQLDPNFPSWVYFVPALHFYRKERYQDALVAAQKINMPEFFNSHAVLALIYAQLGETEKAQAEAAEVLRLKPDYAVWDEWELWNSPASFIEHMADGGAKAALPLRR